MPIFFYSAKNEHGQIARGTIDAISAQAARAALRENDLEAEELHEATLREKNSINNSKQTECSKKKESVTKESTTQKKRSYYPLADTLRLYAGWLLTWYCLVYILGAYQQTKEFPFRIPYVEALLPPFSSIVFSFTLASFLFLLLTGLHKSIGGGRMKALGLTLLGGVVFSLYRLNV